MRIKAFIVHLVTLVIFISYPNAHADTDSLLKQYSKQGASNPDADQGRRMWQKTYAGDGQFTQRSCASCHTKDLVRPGEHVKTGKTIKPLAPSVNPLRLSDDRKVEKWFLRNCKWTLGRECSVQEKADFLAYIESK